MESKEPEKTPKTPKSFLTVGPTLHYSHKNVQRCWLLAAGAFAVACLLWSRIVMGTFWAFDFEAQAPPAFWSLGEVTVSGASIFEYAWQIIVLGLLMGIMAVVPVLIAQLMSFGHSFIFVLAVFFLASLPGFATFLLVSCFAVASRPLRFRSRIIAIALCMTPQLLYWGFFGALRDLEPLEWGVSFTPWIWAWLVGLTIAGLVLGIGHYTRYKPGLTWLFTTTTLLLAVGTFEWRIGFDELDYQFYVAENNPEAVDEFRQHSIREELDRTVNVAMEPQTQDRDKQRLLKILFAASERIPLREEMKEEIRIQLSDDLWPVWFDVPPELQYQDKRKLLLVEYRRFTHPAKPWWVPEVVHNEIRARRLRSARMPIALYYSALLQEYSPDLRRMQQDDMLRFYTDYPQERALAIWTRLYSVADYNDSPESIEARWRIARHTAGQHWLDEPRLIREMEDANDLLTEARDMLQTQLALQDTAQVAAEDSLFSVFRPPAATVMTTVKLRDLARRVHELRTLLGPENHVGADGAVRRLAKYIMLNPHSLEYEQQLDAMLAETSEADGLHDNLLLAKAKIDPDEQGRGLQLEQLSRKYQNTDGGRQALYELTRLKIELYRRDPQKDKLVQARDILTSFLSLYPGSFYVEQVRKNLDDLPRPE